MKSDKERRLNFTKENSSSFQVKLRHKLKQLALSQSEDEERIILPALKHKYFDELKA
jgi:hypothetical protein